MKPITEICTLTNVQLMEIGARGVLMVRAVRLAEAVSNIDGDLVIILHLMEVVHGPHVLQVEGVTVLIVTAILAQVSKQQLFKIRARCFFSILRPIKRYL